MASTMMAKTSAPRSFVGRVNSRVASVKAVSRGSRQVTRAAFETQVVMSAANFACLALGRWAFLPQMRAAAEKAGPPMQNGVSHAEAGDVFAQEASFLTNTGDPAGFNLIDVLIWGSVGHVVGFAILATNASLRIGY